MSASKTPLLSQVLEAAIEGYLDDVRVALPGRIEEYDSATRRATVQALVMDVVVVEGERRTVPLAPLTDVPVMFVGGTGEVLAFDVGAGDQVLLIFSSSSLAAWKSTGALVDPHDDRHHHIADAIAITGLGEPGAAPLIDARGGVVKLGGTGAVDAPIMSQAHTAALHTLVQAIATAVGGIIGAPSGPIGAAAGTAIAVALTAYMGAVNGFTAQKVKVT